MKCCLHKRDRAKFIRIVNVSIVKIFIVAYHETYYGFSVYWMEFLMLLHLILIIREEKT